MTIAGEGSKTMASPCGRPNNHPGRLLQEVLVARDGAESRIMACPTAAPKDTLVCCYGSQWKVSEKTSIWIAFIF